MTKPSGGAGKDPRKKPHVPQPESAAPQPSPELREKFRAINFSALTGKTPPPANDIDDHDPHGNNIPDKTESERIDRDLYRDTYGDFDEMEDFDDLDDDENYEMYDLGLSLLPSNRPEIKTALDVIEPLTVSAIIVARKCEDFYRGKLDDQAVDYMTAAALLTAAADPDAFENDFEEETILNYYNSVFAMNHVEERAFDAYRATDLDGRRIVIATTAGLLDMAEKGLRLGQASPIRNEDFADLAYGLAYESRAALMQGDHTACDRKALVETVEKLNRISAEMHKTTALKELPNGTFSPVTKKPPQQKPKGKKGGLDL